MRLAQGLQGLQGLTDIEQRFYGSNGVSVRRQYRHERWTQ
jgi:hypothetical protein